MLDKEKLIKEIRKLNDSSFNEFVGFPKTCNLATSSWSECFFVYSKEMIPSSANFEIAKSTCKSILSGICSASSMSESASIFVNAITQFAQNVSDGISIANPGVLNGVPPTSTLVLMPIFLKAMNGGSAKEFAEELSEETHNFFKTGTAINVNTGLIINWQ